MKLGWKMVTLSELEERNCLFKDGDWVESKDQDPNGEVRLIQLADIGELSFRDRSDRYLTYNKALELRCTFLQKNDILIARMPDPLGRACIFPLDDDKKFVTVVDVSIFRNKYNDIDNKYICYCLNSPQIREKIISLQSGSTRKRISRTNLGTIILPLAPIQEQINIVSKIDSIFSIMDTSALQFQAIQSKLDALKQSILNAAIRGKLVPQNPDDEPTSVLLEKIKDEKEKLVKKGKIKKEKPLPLIDSNEIPFELPEKWTWVRIGEIFSVYVGSTPKRGISRYWGGKINWLSSGEVNFNEVYHTKETITDIALKESSCVLHPPGTVMLGMIGEGKTRGQTAILRTHSTHNQNIAAIRLDYTECSPEYLYWFLVSNYEKTRKIGSGNNQKALNKERIQNMLFPLPPLKMQTKICEKLSYLSGLIIEIDNYITECKKKNTILKQSILKKAFEGSLI